MIPSYIETGEQAADYVEQRMQAAEKRLKFFKDFNVQEIGSAVIDLGFFQEDDLVRMSWGEIIDNLSADQQDELYSFLQ